MLNIRTIINELNTKFPNFKFSQSHETDKPLTIIKVKSKPGTDDIAYYGGDSCGYVVTNSEFKQIYRYIKSLVPNYRVIDFVDGIRKGFFEICA
jgi:hypothetical protein